MNGKAVMFLGPVIFCFVLDKYVVSIGYSDTGSQVGEPEGTCIASGQIVVKLGMQPNRVRETLQDFG